MFETVVIVFGLSIYKKFNPKKILNDWSIILILGAVGYYILFEISVFTGSKALIWYPFQLSVYFITFLLYFIAAYKNKVDEKHIKMAVIFGIIGLTLNNIVKYVNNGLMPIYPKLSLITGYTKLDMIGSKGDIHMLGNNTVNLKLLTDWIDVGYSIMSPGDILIRICFGMLLYYTFKKRGQNICTNQ